MCPMAVRCRPSVTTSRGSSACKAVCASVFRPNPDARHLIHVAYFPQLSATYFPSCPTPVPCKCRTFLGLYHFVLAQHSAHGKCVVSCLTNDKGGLHHPPAPPSCFSGGTLPFAPYVKYPRFAFVKLNQKNTPVICYTCSDLRHAAGYT